MELKGQKKRMGEPLWKQCLAWLKDWNMVPLELRFGINHIATRVRVGFKVEIMLLAGSEHS